MFLTENSDQVFLPRGCNRTQNLRFGPYTIISKCHAHLQSLTKTTVKFQKDWDKIVGGVALTRYLMAISFSSS